MFKKRTAEQYHRLWLNNELFSNQYFNLTEYNFQIANLQFLCLFILTIQILNSQKGANSCFNGLIVKPAEEVNVSGCRKLKNGHVGWAFVTITTYKCKSKHHREITPAIAVFTEKDMMPLNPVYSAEFKAFVKITCPRTHTSVRLQYQSCIKHAESLGNYTEKRNLKKLHTKITIWLFSRIL